MCLECSGKHRGLGVHISFVRCQAPLDRNPRPSFTLSDDAKLLLCRSVSMDAWSPEQLKKMQLGGNDALNAFLKNYGVDKFTDIRDKYNSQAAEVCPSPCPIT